MRRLRTIRFPTNNVSNCCWGGANFAELFVTSATYFLTEKDRKSQKLAGSVYPVSSGLGFKGVNLAILSMTFRLVQKLYTWKVKKKKKKILLFLPFAFSFSFSLSHLFFLLGSKKKGGGGRAADSAHLDPPLQNCQVIMCNYCCTTQKKNKKINC